LYYPGDAATLAERQPPPDLMPLAGDGGDYQVKWLDPATDFHAKVEFKYPICFLPFRDFAFKEDPVGGELLVAALCEALGPGEPQQTDLLSYRRADDYTKDEDWPFNWLLITWVARSVLAHARYDLEPSLYRKPLSDETRAILQDVEAGAIRWLERSGRWSPLQTVDADVKQAFRVWWVGQLSIYPFQIPRDLGGVIDHTIRYLAAHDERALAAAPRRYVANLKQRNHWKTPSAKQGQYRFFDTAVHQMLGHGSSWQDAPAEHADDVLLLQIQGDDAFFRWHSNCGCVLHFWIGREALSKLDFSQVEATLECD
jgi:hypothetical protein